MEAVRPALPELESGGLEPPSSPVLGTGHRIVAEPVGEPIKRHVENATSLDHRALLRGVGRDLSASGARGEIGICHLVFDLADPPFDAYLTVQLGPYERCCRLRVRLHVLALAAVHAGVEDEARTTQLLHQHSPSRRRALEVRGGQDKGVRLMEPGRDHPGEPFFEFGERVGGYSILIQSDGFVFLPEAGHFFSNHRGDDTLAPMPANLEPTTGTRLGRALRRRCPRCGEPAFETWFGMKRYCTGCGLEFEREPGYWVGAVTINTTVIFGTFLLVFGGLVVITWPEVPWVTVLIVTVVANLAIPTIFYPMSKTIWLALEMGWHPLEREEIEAARDRVRSAGR
jgi:uncharacterized protein (DUF983 family)